MPETTEVVEENSVDLIESAEEDFYADLIDDESVSEEELQGIDDGETTEEETTEEAEKKTGDETQEPEPEKSAKPPKGFVPLEALHEVRGENRYLKEQIAELQAAPPKETAPKADAEEAKPEFEVLSDEDFDALVDEDPLKAIRYQRDLNTHERLVSKQEADYAKGETEFASTVREAQTAMETAVPGIFTEEGVQRALVEKAESLGFSEDLFYLTNPSTQVILPGSSEPVLLGKAAASILSVIQNASAKSTEKVKSEDEIREEVTAELMKKFKSGDGDFKSLTLAPKSKNTKIAKGKELSESDMLKLSDADLEIYLAGE